MTGQIRILSPSLTLMSNTHPDCLAPPDEEDELNKDEPNEEDKSKSDNEYVPDSDVRVLCDDSNDIPLTLLKMTVV